MAVVFSAIFCFEIENQPVQIRVWVTGEFFARATSVMAGDIQATREITSRFRVPRSAFLVESVLSTLFKSALAMVVPAAVMAAIGHPFARASVTVRADMFARVCRAPASRRDRGQLVALSRGPIPSLNIETSIDRHGMALRCCVQPNRDRCGRRFTTAERRGPAAETRSATAVSEHPEIRLDETTGRAAQSAPLRPRGGAEASRAKMQISMW